MEDIKRPAEGHSNFEEKIKNYLNEAREKLLKELEGTRGAIKLLANDKAKDFMRITDIGFNKDERQFLNDLLVSSMYQSFCYGYGIGKMEGTTKKKIYL